MNETPYFAEASEDLIFAFTGKEKRHVEKKDMEKKPCSVLRKLKKAFC